MTTSTAKESAIKKRQPIRAANGSGALAAVQSVEIAAAILQALADAGQPVRVSDLARSMQHTKARVHRHLVTLRRLGLVAQEPETERYYLGWRMFDLGVAAGRQYDIKRVAEPVMNELRDHLEETVVLSVPVNDEAMVVACSVYSTNVCITVQEGNRLPAVGSAQGRVLLAFQDQPVLPAAGENGFTANDAELLDARLKLIRKRFYDFAPNEVLAGINTIAVPVFGGRDRILGAIGIVGLVQNLPGAPSPQQLQWLRKAAGAISRHLGSDIYGD